MKHLKKEKSFENKVIFTSPLNPRGPNLSEIINRHMSLTKNLPFIHKILPDGSILVAHKHCQNLKNLLDRDDLYNIKHDLTDIIPHEDRPCGKRCDVR